MVSATRSAEARCKRFLREKSRGENVRGMPYYGNRSCVTVYSVPNMSPALRLITPASAAMLALSACVSLRGSGLEQLNRQPPETFRGHYTFGASGSWFRSCTASQSDSTWWVTVTNDAVPKIEDAKRSGQLSDGRSIFVVWRAVLTRGGEVGPRGPGYPALLVRDVDLIRPAGTFAADCSGR